MFIGTGKVCIELLPKTLPLTENNRPSKSGD